MGEKGFGLHYEIVKSIVNEKLHVFRVKFAQHGTPIYGESVKKTLCKETTQLIELCKKYNRKEITRMRYMGDTSGWIKAIYIESGSFCKHLIKNIWKV